MLTLHEIFDKVKNHLLSQRKKSKGLFGSLSICQYRGSAGTKCAIGCLIPDELYTQEIEGKGCGNSIVQEILKKAGVLPEHDCYARTRLLKDLQTIHDCYNIQKWKEELETLRHNTFID